jgi:hypothetical protein
VKEPSLTERQDDVMRKKFEMVEIKMMAGRRSKYITDAKMHSTVPKRACGCSVPGVLETSKLKITGWEKRKTSVASMVKLN